VAVGAPARRAFHGHNHKCNFLAPSLLLSFCLSPPRLSHGITPAPHLGPDPLLASLKMLPHSPATCLWLPCMHHAAVDATKAASGLSACPS